MALTKREFQKLKRKCGKLPDGPDYREKDYVTNLLLTVLDFYMRVETVVKALKYFRKNHKFRTHKKLKSYSDTFPNTREGNKRLANSLWNNDHWSRAKFLRKLMKELEARGVKGKNSLKKWVRSSNFERDVKGQFKTKEHSVGDTIFSWLQLRLGVPTVKPDRHVVRFVSNAVDRKVSEQEVKESLRLVAEQTEREPALLDSAIWHHQRGVAWL